MLLLHLLVFPFCRLVMMFKMTESLTVKRRFRKYMLVPKPHACKLKSSMLDLHVVAGTRE